MESVFSRFDSYNFEADRRFQEGLKGLNKSNICRDETKQLDMKLFFYNRFIEPIDQTSYKQRRSASSHVTPVDCSSIVEQLNQATPSDSDSDISKKETTETSAETEPEQLSFAEVMRLIQEGKEVPGVKNLDIRPTNESPTPPQMERILKPWEVASVSK
ncbi:uncharacterized protein C6orf226 homolog [Scomber scombrus]|uniref:Uncharacterized protein C6orf226 homolog n=1 Tax=Scomber scombrus TaxID=13677 RepID=A0AAV1NZE3_SCOSC